MNKVLFFLAGILLAFSSSFAFASNESCEIKAVFKSTFNHKTQNDAQKFCSQYDFSRVPCRVSQLGYDSYDSVIDFNEVFRGQGSTFNDARTSAYRSFFNFLEGRKIFSLPSSFTVVFNCRSNGNGGGGYFNEEDIE